MERPAQRTRSDKDHSGAATQEGDRTGAESAAAMQGVARTAIGHGLKKIASVFVPTGIPGSERFVGFLVDQVAQPAVDSMLSALVSLPSVPKTEPQLEGDELNALNVEKGCDSNEGIRTVEGSADTVLEGTPSADPPKGNEHASNIVYSNLFGASVPGSEEVLPSRSSLPPPPPGPPTGPEVVDGILEHSEALHATFRSLYRLQFRNAKDPFVLDGQARGLLENAMKSLAGISQAADQLSARCFNPAMPLNQRRPESERLLKQVLDLQSSANACIVAMVEDLADLERRAGLVREEAGTQTERKPTFLQKLVACLTGEAYEDPLAWSYARMSKERPTDRVNALVNRFLAALDRLLDVVETTNPNDLPSLDQFGPRALGMRRSLRNLYPSLPGLDRPPVKDSPKPSAPTASVLGSLLRIGSVWGKAPSRPRF